MTFRGYAHDQSRQFGARVLSPTAHRSWYGGAEVGQMLWTPSMIHDRLVTINTKWDSVANDILGSDIPSAAFKAAFKADWDSWKLFFNNSQSTTLGVRLSEWWGGNISVADRHLAKANQWTASFQALGGTPINPTTTPELPQGGMDSTLTKVAIIAGIVVVGVIAVEVLPIFKH